MDGLYACFFPWRGRNKRNIGYNNKRENQTNEMLLFSPHSLTLSPPMLQSVIAGHESREQAAIQHFVAGMGGTLL